MKKLAKILAVFFTLSILFSFFDRIPIAAAAKQTVRVTTQKELNKALKNSKVDTIIFRSDIYADITINSKKAKKKNIIIDAPYCNIVNKSKFKSTYLEDADSYIEDITGNTITTDCYFDLEVAKGRTVKKVIAAGTDPTFILREGASIKTLTFDHIGHKGVYDSKTNTIKLDTEEFEEGDSYPVSYTYTIDKSGRILQFLREYPNAPSYKQFCKYTYDKNGNITKVEQIDTETQEVLWDYEYKYDSQNREIASIFKGNETVTREYDSKGHLTGYATNSDLYCDKASYTLDKNGRRISSVFESYYIGDDGEISNKKTYETTYKYDKNGNQTLVSTISSDGSYDVYTYKYDKAGNMIHSKNEEYRAETDVTSTWESKYEYDEEGKKTSALSKSPYSDEWYDPYLYAG